jgi:hypothetical protein
LDEFKQLKLETLCPFAKSAKIWYGPDWDFALTFRENVSSQTDDLRRFAQSALVGRFHGYVAEIGIGKAATEFESVRHAFRNYLRELASSDESCNRCFETNPMDLGWQFEYANVRMFLNVFAPCYQRPHSKSVNAPDRFFVFFQPEFSFDFCGIDPGSKNTKRKIRESFAMAGMPYNGAQIDARHEALLYMFPADPFGLPVNWWE